MKTSSFTQHHKMSPAFRTLNYLIKVATARRLLRCSSSSSCTESFLRASRGDKAPLLKCFPLQSHHIAHTADGHRLSCQSPAEFHNELCRRIVQAKKRVLLATLYIGTSSSSKEEAQLLSALKQAAVNLRQPEQQNKTQPFVGVKILMDASRARRKLPSLDGTTCAAKDVYNCINSSNHGGGVYLFKVHPWTELIPSPFNEAVGVFHMKAYVVDDCLILSGANLSEEYFVNRHDRYLVFTNGANGLVDFYSNLIELLCTYSAEEYGETKSTEKKIPLSTELQDLFSCTDIKKTDNDDVIAYAIPTIQFPLAYYEDGFLRKKLAFASDVKIIQNLIQTCTSIVQVKEKNNAETRKTIPSLRLASAYLNPTRSFMKILKGPQNEVHKSSNVYLLTAGKKSHGFAPKKGGKSGTSARTTWVPWAFHEIANQINNQLLKNHNTSFVSLFNQQDWTFHSKGLWISFEYCDKANGNENQQSENLKQDQAKIKNPNDLKVVVIGSGNYGSRSERLDLESNCVLVLAPPSKRNSGGDAASWLQQEFSNEWNRYIKKSHPITSNDVERNWFMKRFILPAVRLFL